MQQNKPRNPRIPEPELATCTIGRNGYYAWVIDKHGIKTYSNSKKDAKREWREAYKFEYFYGEGA